MAAEPVAVRVELAEGVEDDKVGEGRGHALLTYRPAPVPQGGELPQPCPLSAPRRLGPCDPRPQRLTQGCPCRGRTLATTRRSCDICVMAEGPIDSDGQLRLKANIDRAQRATAARKRPRVRLQFIRLQVERVVRASKPDATVQ
jgi:hypothetical protein